MLKIKNEVKVEKGTKQTLVTFPMLAQHIPLLYLCSQDIQCDLDMNLLCWGSGDLGQTGHGRPGEIGPEEAHLREFTMARLGRAKLLACGSSHSIVVTGTGPQFPCVQLFVFYCTLWMSKLHSLFLDELVHYITF